MVKCVILITLKYILSVISSEAYVFEYWGPQEVLFGEGVEPWKVQFNGRK